MEYDSSRVELVGGGAAGGGGARGGGGGGGGEDLDDDAFAPSYNKQFCIIISDASASARSLASSCAATIIRNDLASPLASASRTALVTFGHSSQSAYKHGKGGADDKRSRRGVETTWKLMPHSAKAIKTLNKKAKLAADEENVALLAKAKRLAQTSVKATWDDDDDDDDDDNNNQSKYTSAQLRDALKQALHMLTELGSVANSADKRVFLFVANAAPVDAATDRKESIIGVEHAIDQLEQLDAVVYVVPVLATSGAFPWHYFGGLHLRGEESEKDKEPALFYIGDGWRGDDVPTDAVELTNVPDAEQMALLFEEFNGQCKDRALRDEPSRLVMAVNDNGANTKAMLEVAVRLVRPYTIASATRYQRRTAAASNEEVRATTVFRDARDGYEIDLSRKELNAMPRHFNYPAKKPGGKQQEVVLPMEAVEALRRPPAARNGFGSGMYVVGTKPLCKLRDWHQLNCRSSIVKPDRRDAASCRIFVALHKALREDDRMMICRHELKRGGGAPGTLTALVPATLPTYGFAAIRLPYLDDLRDDPPLLMPPSNVLPPPPVPDAVAEACNAVVRSMTVRTTGKFLTTHIENPDVAWRRRLVEAFALDENLDASVDLKDQTLHDETRMVENGAAHAIKTFAKVVAEEVANPSSSSGKRKRAAGL